MKNRFLPILLLVSCLLWLAVSNVSALNYIEANNQAVELAKKGEFFTAVDLLKNAISQSTNNQTLRQNLASIYETGAEHYLHRERFEELAELMLDAQEFDDSQAYYWTMRGFALFKLKNYYEAEVDLQEARSMRNNDQYVLFLLGQLYYQTDRMYEAFDVLESAALLAPEDHAIVRMLEKVRRELAVERKMDKEYGGHFVITFDGEQDERLGAEVLEALEEAFNWVGRQLDYYPEKRVTVLLYTRQQFSDLTDSPDWAGGLYDGKIRLPVGGVSEMNDKLRALLYHEYMHVVLRDIAGRNIPYWLNEGLAEVAEAKFKDPQLEIFEMAREQQQLFRLQQLEGSFRHLDGMQALLAYQQSYSVVQYLIDEYGWHLMRDLIFSLGDGHSIAEAVLEAYGIYGLNYQRLEDDWRR